jgi:hypothetical protein
MHSVEAAVPDVVVSGLHSLSALSFEENTLVLALRVALPEYTVCSEEAASVANGDSVLMI